MTVLGIDEDWSKADPAALADAGYRFVVGYVSEDTTGKNLARAQIDAAHAAGLSVGLVYEYATDGAKQGAPRGTRDAGIAVTHAQQLAAPAGVCLYHAVDYQAPAADMPAILAYAVAGQKVCAAAGYRHGIYADYAVCKYLREHGYTGLLWQTYAWSAGQWYAGVAVRQTQNGIHVAGATVDKDEAQVDDWGQWEAQMAFTPQQEALIVAGCSTILRQARGFGTLDDGKEPNQFYNAVVSTQKAVAAIQPATPAAVDPAVLAAALASNDTFVQALAAALASHIKVA